MRIWAAVVGPKYWCVARCCFPIWVRQQGQRPVTKAASRASHSSRATSTSSSKQLRLEACGKGCLRLVLVAAASALAGATAPLVYRRWGCSTGNAGNSL
jgi:hypothetical protein